MNSVLCVNAARMEKINTLRLRETVSIFNLHDYKIRNFNINIMLYIYISYKYILTFTPVTTLIFQNRFDILSIETYPKTKCRNSLYHPRFCSGLGQAQHDPKNQGHVVWSLVTLGSLAPHWMRTGPGHFPKWTF